LPPASNQILGNFNAFIYPLCLNIQSFTFILKKQVKSKFFRFAVMSAKAGIQLIQGILDAGSSPA